MAEHNEMAETETATTEYSKNRESPDYGHKDHKKPVHKVVAQDDMFSGNQDTFIFGNVLKNDYDTYKHDLDAYVIDKPDYGTLYLDKESGHFKYKPNEGFTGTDYFEYKAFDKYKVYDTAKVKIEVRPVEKHVVDAVNVTYSVKEGDKLKGNVLANDTDTNKKHDLDVASYTQPKYGKLKLDKETGDFVYKPFNDKDKEDEVDTFTYTVTDGYGGTDTATVTINIKDDDYRKKDKKYYGDEQPIAYDDKESPDASTPDYMLTA